MELKELKKEVAHIAEIGLKVFEKDKQLAPVLFVIHTLTNGEESVAMCPILNPDKRFETLYAAGKIFKEKKDVERVNAVIMGSEAWMSVADKSKGKEEHEKIMKGKPVLRPSQDPNRIDTIVISGMSDKYESVTKIYEIKNRGTASQQCKEYAEETEDESMQYNNYLLNQFWKGLGVLIETAK